MAKQLIIEIRPGKATKIEAFGFNGTGCKEATGLLTEGKEVVDEQLKAEAYEIVVTQDTSVNLY